MWWCRVFWLPLGDPFQYIIMERLPASSSSELRRHYCEREIERALVCTGNRHKCSCRRCRFYRREHWGLQQLSTSEDSSSEEEEEEYRYMSSSKHHHLEYPHSSSSAKSNSARGYFRPQQYCARTSTVFTGIITTVIVSSTAHYQLERKKSSLCLLHNDLHWCTTGCMHRPTNETMAVIYWT